MQLEKNYISSLLKKNIFVADFRNAVTKHSKNNYQPT